MHNLELGQRGYVDLYYNDLHCLQVALGRIKYQSEDSQAQPVCDRALEEIGLAAFKLTCLESVQPIGGNMHVQVFSKYFPELDSLAFSL